jgi:Right handed beta helix region
MVPSNGGMGAVPGLSASNIAAQNRVALLAALNSSSGSYFVPSGDYLIDNTYSTPDNFETGLKVLSFTGQLICSPMARFIYTDNTCRGLLFAFCGPFRVANYHYEYQTPGPTRIATADGFLVYDSTDVEVLNIYGNGSSGAGAIFGQVIRPRVIGATLRNSKADGLHFNNCQDPMVVDVDCENTGDDGLAFVNYQSGTNNQGAFATNVRIKNSEGNGITSIGQSGVSVSNFQIDSTRVGGIYVGEQVPWSSRVPERVTISNGVIKDPGRYSSPMVIGAGVNLETCGRGIELANITVINPATHGVVAYNSALTSARQISLKDVTVYDCAAQGFSIQYQADVHMDGCTVIGSNEEGFFFQQNTNVAFGTLTAQDTSKTTASRLALSCVGNGVVLGDSLIMLPVASGTSHLGVQVNFSGTNTASGLAQVGALSTIIRRNHPTFAYALNKPAAMPAPVVVVAG